MQCTVCGKEVPTGWLFCSPCIEAVSTVAHDQRQAPMPRAPAIKRLNLPGKTFLGAAALLLVATIAFDFLMR
jgi:hypothetical protein